VWDAAWASHLWPLLWRGGRIPSHAEAAGHTVDGHTSNAPKEGTVMPARVVSPHATRLLATALGLALAGLLTLTACDDGQGVRDEGPAATGRVAADHS
jgi:hypothetical protein